MRLAAIGFLKGKTWGVLPKTAVKRSVQGGGKKEIKRDKGSHRRPECLNDGRALSKKSHQGQSRPFDVSLMAVVKKKSGARIGREEALIGPARKRS